MQTQTVTLTNYFDCIRIINLEHRDDRRREVANELKKLSMTIGSDNVSFFSAVKPDDAADFPSKGARGCYMSHLGVLKKAYEQNVKRLLILEDDVNFIHTTNDELPAILTELSELEWDICYLGHHLALDETSGDGRFQYYDDSIQTTHSYAINGRILPELIAFLETVLSRNPGDPLGGPMHVDGAISTFRAQNRNIKTLVLCKPLTYQRPSKTDIHDLRWFDKLPVIRGCIAMLRKVKNKVKAQ